ncbi:MAG: hypothetical protein AB1348_07220, partial [Nitrospirota bacterium]
MLSSLYLWRYLEDREENTFYQFYEEDDFPGFLKEEDIRLLGISITSPSQAIAALTLGLLVKNTCPIFMSAWAVNGLHCIEPPFYKK